MRKVLQKHIGIERNWESKLPNANFCSKKARVGTSATASRKGQKDVENA
jgi:hypothetical protein